MTDVNLVIAIPTAGRVPMAFAYSLAGLIGHVAAHRVRTLPEATIQLSMDVIESSNWIENREQAVMRAIEAGKTHIMWLDDDMSFEPTVLEVLLGRRQPIVVTNYLIKTENPEFVAVSEDGSRRIKTDEKTTGLEPVAYSGFGVSVFETRVFKDVPQPWFLPDWDAEGKKYTTEDNPCMRKIREAGHKIWLDHDASKLISHIGQRAWNWRAVNA